jgi:hypothetical protein
LGEGNKIYPLLYVVVVLDPLKKLMFLKFCFTNVYGDIVASAKIANVRDVLSKLYEYYSSAHSPMWK